MLMDEYPLVDGHVPQQSMLTPLQPIGIGTWRVESLLSYIRRLAYIHALPLGTLVYRIVMQAMGRSAPQRGATWLLPTKTPGFSGFSESTERMVAALESVTGYHGLQACTLLPLKRAVAEKRLTARIPRYCPQCVTEAGELENVHGQLLWEVCIVSACPVHRVRLVSELGCPAAERQAVGRAVSLPGICRKCCIVGKTCGSMEIEVATDIEIETASVVGELLAAVSAGPSSLSAGGFQVTLRRAVEATANHQPSVFARRMLASKTQMPGWLSGKHRPELSRAVDLARLLRCSLHTVLSGGPDDAHLATVGPSPRLSSSCVQRRRRNPVPRAQKLQALRTALDSDDSPSVIRVAASLGVDGSGLRHSFPVEAKRLSAKWRAQQELEHQARFDERVEACRTAFAQLQAEGRVVGLKGLMQCSDGKLTFFSNRDFELAKQVAQELGIEFLAEH